MEWNGRSGMIAVQALLMYLCAGAALLCQLLVPLDPLRILRTDPRPLGRPLGLLGHAWLAQSNRIETAVVLLCVRHAFYPGTARNTISLLDVEPRANRRVAWLSASSNGCVSSSCVDADADARP
jgi:hypothetical protein